MCSSEQVFADWCAETVFAYCRAHADLLGSDITIDDIVKVIDSTPDPPVGWIAFYDDKKDGEHGKEIRTGVEGPYWCEKDITEDLETYAVSDKRIVERTTLLDDDDMCEWLDNFISATLKERRTTTNQPINNSNESSNQTK